MLDVIGVTAGYGRSTVLADVSIRVADGEAVTVLGPNGAGKSTLMQVVMGMLPLQRGEIRLDGELISGLHTAQIVRRRMVLCPERRHLFPGMTVQENLVLGAYLRRDRNQMKDDLERVTAMFPALGDKRRLAAGLLSGGEQQMLAIGRALMARPRLLLLDEPSLGLAPIMVETVAHEIKKINADGIAVCLVEQNAQVALAVVDRAYVLESGQVVLEGSSRELADDDRVRAAYLGLT